MPAACIRRAKHFSNSRGPHAYLSRQPRQESRFALACGVLPCARCSASVCGVRVRLARRYSAGRRTKGFPSNPSRGAETYPVKSSDELTRRLILRDCTYALGKIFSCTRCWIFAFAIVKVETA